VPGLDTRCARFDLLTRSADRPRLVSILDQETSPPRVAVAPSPDRLSSQPGRTPPHRRRFIGASVVGILAAMVLLLEAAPILLYQLAGTLWFLNDPELAAWTFWMPLKSDLHDSYVYVYAGFGFWASLRLVHAVTAALMHSQEATLDYMQLYGLLTHVFLFIISTLLVLFIVLTRALSWSAKIAALAFMAFLVVGTAQLFWMYSARETMEAAIKPLAAGGFILLLLEMERVFGNRRLRSNWFALVAGAFFGGVFFQESVYTYLAVFFIVVAAVGRTFWEFVRYSAVFVLGAVIGGLGELLWFYQGDVDSTGAALVSHITAILAGVPLPQPDFDQEYWVKFLSLDSRYLIDQLILIGAVLVCILTLAACGVAVIRRQQSLVTTILLPLSIAYVFVALVHWKIFQTHGSTTTAFSLTIASALYLIASLYVVVRSGAVRTYWYLFSWHVAAIAVLVGLSGAYNLEFWAAGRGTTYYRLSETYTRRKLSNDATLAAAFRQFDQTLNVVAPHYTIVNNAELYWSNAFLGWQDYPAEGFYHEGSVWGPTDLRYGMLLEQGHHPRYTLFTSSAVVDVSKSCTDNDPAVLTSQLAGQSQCAPLFDGLAQLQVDVAYLRQPANLTGVWIVPVASAFSSPEIRGPAENLARDALSRAQLLPVTETAAFATDVSSISPSPSEGLISDKALTSHQLMATPDSSGTFDPRTGWTIVPVTNDEALAFQAPEVETLLANGYRPYLSVVSIMGVSYQLMLFPPT